MVKEGITNNKYISGFISLLLALYAVFLAPKLPNQVLYFFDGAFGRLLFLFLVAYVASEGNFQVAIMIALALSITLMFANNEKTKESFINQYETFTSKSNKSSKKKRGKGKERKDTEVKGVADINDIDGLDDIDGASVDDASSISDTTDQEDIQDTESDTDSRQEVKRSEEPDEHDDDDEDLDETNDSRADKGLDPDEVCDNYDGDSSSGSRTRTSKKTKKKTVESFTNYPSSGGSSLLTKGKTNYFAPY